MKEIIIRRFNDKTLDHAKKRGEAKVEMSKLILFLEAQLAVTGAFDEENLISGLISLQSKMIAANGVQAQLDAYEGLILYVD